MAGSGNPVTNYTETTIRAGTGKISNHQSAIPNQQLAAFLHIADWGLLIADC